MSLIENPQSFVTFIDSDKLTFANGFHIMVGEVAGWRQYRSTTVQGSIWLARKTEGGWLLALDHAGVLAELGLEPVTCAGPGIARLMFHDLAELYRIMPRVYQLSLTLPDAPLMEFQQETASLPSSTEAERLVIQRKGQDIFRKSLMTYWQQSCPLTGVTDPELLRASHIKPWNVCANDRERLDVHNGFLLSALWDAAFDKGLVTFEDDGSAIFSSRLSTAARKYLVSDATLRLTDAHRAYLSWHRDEVFTDGMIS